MSISRREFLQTLGAAAAAGFALDARTASQASSFYDLPRFGNVSLLHFTDCHAQLLPVHFREPHVSLGVDVMTGHWEFTYGAARVKEVVERDFAGKIEFLAQNVQTNDFGDPVFKPYAIRELAGVPVGIIGQAFPYTPIAHPRRFVAEWKFGIEEERLQRLADEIRGRGAQVVVLLSHNGMDVDLKLASRVARIDVILGGPTHDGVPEPVVGSNAKGSTLGTNAGSNGKFLAVLDLDIRGR